MMADQETIRLAGADGLSLAADRYGGATGDPVILLHGGGQTRHAWGATARMLADRGYAVLSLDLRGHGDSDWSPEKRYDPGAFRDDLRAVLATFDRPVILIGASLGGITSLLVAGEGPQHMVRALVLVDITPVPQQEGADHIMAFMTADLDGFANVDDAAAAVARYLPHRPRPRNADGLMKNLRLRGDRLHWHWDPSFVSLTAAALDGDRLLRASRAIAAPALLVRGAESDVVSAQDAQDFVGQIPHARLVEVTGATHMVAGDQNTVFSSALLRFLDEIAPPSAQITTGVLS